MPIPKPTILLFLACLIPENQQAQIIKELSQNEIAQLKKEGEIVKIENKKGFTWPNIKVYKITSAQPDTIKDLFLDYEKSPLFIKSVKSAKVENSPSINVQDVRYHIKLPILLNISYLVRNKYEKTPHGHVVSWQLIESPLAKSANGSLRIEEHPIGSIVCYSNHLDPATKLVAGLKGHAIKQASTTIQSIIKEAEKSEVDKK